MTTAGVGEAAVGLTMLIVVVTAVVWPAPHTELVATPVIQVDAVVELTGWVTVAVVVAVVVVGVTTEDAEETVFITELTLPDWLDITTLDWQSSVLEAPVSVTSLLWFSCEGGEVTGPTRLPCWARADTLVPFPFWAMLATM